MGYVTCEGTRRWRYFEYMLREDKRCVELVLVGCSLQELGTDISLQDGWPC